MTDSNKNRANKGNQSFEDKKKKEQLYDDIPMEDLKKEEREQEKGNQSKNDSSSEEKYDEDLRP
ncbi:hypothetical protein [Halobacillus yeomjeoni]|uniref:Uncharacterized protein n=1 Tax=Halobacillus yeomjeoni TaxID=311194 RepID=A0A931HXE3_9BACI|nr:hypothetical protein [Halobacillus yeomjeoni]MBH0231233.1 hypothetical protein [Halobacillus yeomjeoni]